MGPRSGFYTPALFLVLTSPAATPFNPHPSQPSPRRGPIGSPSATEAARGNVLHGAAQASVTSALFIDVTVAPTRYARRRPGLPGDAERPESLNLTSAAGPTGKG